MKFNLSKRITLFIVILVVAACLILGLITINISKQALIDASEDTMLEYSEECARQVDAEIAKNLAILSEIAIRARTATMDWTIQKESLIVDVERLGYLDMAVVLPDGTARYILTDEYADLGDREYIQKALKGEANTSDVLISKVTGDMVVMEAAPIKSGDSILGVLIGRREGTYISNITDELGFGERGYAFILSSDSTIISHVNKDLVLEQKNVFADIEANGDLKEYGIALNELGLGNSGIVKYEFEGENRLTAMAPIPGTDWTLGIGNYESDILYGINKQITFIIIISAFVIAAGFLYGFIIARKISRPILQLKAAADKLAVGDVDVELKSTSNDEIGDLMNSFADLAGNIKKQALIGEKIASGDLSEDIVPRSDKDVLAISMKSIIGSLRALVNETKMLTETASEGDLKTRGNADAFEGGFREIIEGMNNTLSAVVEPISEALGVLKEVANGNLHVSVEGDYKGDHAELKNALNATIENILSYVSELTNVLSEIGEGNLDLAITADYRGDFVEIKDSLNNIINSLNQIMGDINEAAEQVSAGAIQVSDGSQTLSQGSTEQASSIEELTASIAEIASQTKQNALSISQVDELSRNMSDNASKGNTQMKDMLKSMEEINDASTNISKIIKVIDDIAFQTNILALNAAVEAARAGQHGKGFAVVAEEVRSLAARSAEAANETTGLIEGSMNKVQAGTKIANETAAAFDSIVREIDKARALISDISQASNEQATAIAQIDRGIEQVSQVVQSNSATAEESAAASEELSGQAEMLKEMVAKFKLNRESGRLSGREVKLIGSDNHSSESADCEDQTPVKQKILLNDNEFDKY